MAVVSSNALFYAITFLVSIANGSSLNILGIFPHCGISHFHFFSPIMRGLVDAGHNVTVISHFPDKNPPQGYRDLPLTGRNTLHNSVDLKVFEKRYIFNHFIEFFLLWEWGTDACNVTLNSDALTEVLNEKVSYDVILMEHFNTDCGMGIAHVLNAPVIGLSSAGFMPWHYEYMGIPVIPSYIPALFMCQSDEMDLPSRLANWLTTHALKLLYRLLVVPSTDELLRQKFGRDFPSSGDLVKDTSLFFFNHHFSFSGVMPLPPSVIPLGGIHIQKAKPLNKELQSFLDSAEHGVILISWGSMIKAETLTVAKRDDILNAVRRLKQKVIWKWENDTLPNKPDNMLIRKWLPQRDILCHPNVKVFMTHAGLMGSSEAVHCGVPMIATPMYGDQFLNAAAIKKRGMGDILHYEDISEENVYNALTKVLQKSYMDNTKLVSESFNNRQQTPLETAVWWVEYVAKTKGAPLIKSHAAHMSRFVYYSLDVYLILASMVAVFSYCSTIIIRKFCLRKQNRNKLKEN